MPATIRTATRGLPFLLVAALLVLSADAVLAFNMTLRVQDGGGQIVPSRVRVVDSQGHFAPSAPDSSLLSHQDGIWMGSYFYPNGPVTLSVPAGSTTVTAGRGFEWRTVRVVANIQQDTTLVLTLDHPIDMRSQGWYSGDEHVHTDHDPITYAMGPWQIHRVAQAEDVSIFWCLDNEYHFTGATDPISTPDAIIYYTVEYRNQAYGHAALLGLRQIFSIGCCTPPAAATPMISQIREGWAPQWDQALVLAHPLTDAGFMQDDGWPAWGLGREAMVMASSHNMDVYDIVSYSNLGDIAVSDWYGFLNCGFRIPPGAGTDAISNYYWNRPPGGYRVYVREDGTHSASTWVQNLKAGRVFVTNGPLITAFTVDGAEAGTVLQRTGTPTVSVQMHVESLIPVTSAVLIRNGQPEQTYSLPGNPGGTTWDKTVNVTLTESSWLALRVNGTTTSPFIVGPALFAHTGPVYVQIDSSRVERTVDAGGFLDDIDSLQNFVENRDNWPSDAAHQAVLARLNDSRTVYRGYFHQPPGAFALVAPADSDTVRADSTLFDWTDAIDPEPGDRVKYQLSIAGDTLFSTGYTPPAVYDSQLLLTHSPLVPNRAYWWRVTAQDRAGNSTISTPRRRLVYLRDYASAVPTSPLVVLDEPLRAWPNPSTGRIMLGWNRPGPGGGSFQIFDAGGRIVARIPEGPAGSGSGAGTVVWDGRNSSGQTQPSGVYWVRYYGAAGKTLPAGRTATILVIR